MGTDHGLARPLRRVGCHLAFDVGEDLVLALAVAVAPTAGDRVDEDLRVDLDGGEAAVEELSASDSGRIHLVRSGAGRLEIDYRASVRPPGAAPPTATAGAAGIDEPAIVALRQSRYCPSDALFGFAATTFPEAAPPSERARAVAEWVFERLAYRPGSSGPLDTAVETLLSGAGVCRDFAHLTITLCRALGVPARLTSVYAPGLSPMDFHAVVEVRGDAGWEVLDPSRLAPRSSLVRIATGRDAADTAFATTLHGDAQLRSIDVTAVVDGDLPSDGHRAPVHLE
jgi:transglutaminase-like putative cysteine protease